jgi:hypothetical protein
MQVQNQFMRERKQLLDESKSTLSKLDYLERRNHFRNNAFEGSGHLFDLRNNRETYLKEFGPVRPSSLALEKIKCLGLPIVEMGAALGHWSQQLSQCGVTVLAALEPSMQDKNNYSQDKNLTDDSRRPLMYGTPVYPVQHGTPRDLKKFSSQQYALLLVCPPGNNLALESVEMFSGQMLIYVGEGKRGNHANRAFFKRVEQEFDLVDVVTDLSVFDEYSFERMWILKRK